VKLEAVLEVVAVVPSLVRQVRAYEGLCGPQKEALERIEVLCADADHELGMVDDSERAIQDGRWAMVADRFDRIDRALEGGGEGSMRRKDVMDLLYSMLRPLESRVAALEAERKRGAGYNLDDKHRLMRDLDRRGR